MNAEKVFIISLYSLFIMYNFMTIIVKKKSEWSWKKKLTSMVKVSYKSSF